MLVILWCKLILPKRISMETSLKAKEAEFHAASGEASRQNELPLGQPTPEPAMPPLETLSKEEAEIMEKEKKESDKIFVKMKELWAEFGEHFSSKTFFKAVLTRLSRLQFIRIHNEIITEGIFLDLLIDGQQMANEIKRSALAYKLAGLGEDDDEKEDFMDGEDDDETEEMIEVSELEGSEEMEEDELEEETD